MESWGSTRGGACLGTPARFKELQPKNHRRGPSTWCLCHHQLVRRLSPVELRAVSGVAKWLACLLVVIAVARAQTAKLDHEKQLHHEQRRQHFDDSIVQSEKEWQAIKERLAASLDESLSLELERPTSEISKIAKPQLHFEQPIRSGGQLSSALKQENSAGDQLRAKQQVGSKLVRHLDARVLAGEPGDASERQARAKQKDPKRQEVKVRNRKSPEEPSGDERGLGAALEFSANTEAEQQQQQQQNSSGSSETMDTSGGGGGELVTCSPDYEDAPTVLVDTSGGAETNLTAEQQAQLISGNYDALGSPQAAHNASGGGGGGGLTQFNGPAQCMPAGARMIEVITKIITPILFSIIIVVGLLGNIIVMLVILEDRKTERELTPTNLLILDLSLADLSFIILCIPFTGWDYAVGHWVFGQIWCKFNQYLIVVCALSSIYTLVLMSIDRFMAIVYPIECISYRTSSNMLHAIVIKWVLIFFIASPTIAMHGLIESPLGPGQYTCRFLADQYNPLHFQIVFFVTSYLSPLVLIFCLYLKLLNKLWFGNRPQGHKESLKMLESKKRVTWLVASIVIVFALCWFPIQMMLILMRLKTHKITATYVAIQVFAHILGYMNSCINPIVYAFASETFNQSFRRSWLGRTFWHCFRTCCCCCASCCTPMAAGSGCGNAPGSRSMSLANAQQPVTVNYHSDQQHSTRGNGNGGQLTLMHMERGQTRNRSLNHVFSPIPNLLASAHSSTALRNNTKICSNNLHLQKSARSIDVEPSDETRDTSLEALKQQQRQQAGGTKFRSTTPLPLEPRDRPSLPPQTQTTLVRSQTSCPAAARQQPNNGAESHTYQSNGGSPSASTTSVISQTPTSSGVSYYEYNALKTGIQTPETGACAQANSCHHNYKIATSNVGAPQQQQQPPSSQQKQQLVARMISSQDGSQQAVAHECEPCLHAGLSPDAPSRELP